MFRYFVIYKPFGMLSQFSTELNKITLADLDFKFPKDVYPIGRLDEDSEGLLILTNDKALNTKLLDPSNLHPRLYWVQVESEITQLAIDKLEKGVTIKPKDKPYLTLPAKASLLNSNTNIPKRVPPIRFRAAIPTSWIQLELMEGKNRQVRKMTAQVGFPTLRLIRFSIEDLKLPDLLPGGIWEMSKLEMYKLLKL
jgi:23S rRNA pseudouridine2457 synthase